ncbi:MAG: L,D-transpeptidase [Methylotetracoccus sp.]
MSVGRPLNRWLLLGLVAATVGGGFLYVRDQLMPMGVAMTPVDGIQAADPRQPILIHALGLGARIARAELRDADGRVLASAADKRRIAFERPLDFGTRYQVDVTVERPWLGQTRLHQLSLKTVDVPKLFESDALSLAPDASVTLHFDRPVGELQTTGNLAMSVEPDASRRSFRLVAGDFPHGQTVPVEVAWQSAEGVPLPPLKLAITTPPALNAEISPRGEKNLGLAMPVQVTFSEQLADRDVVGSHISVRTGDGRDVAGRWRWYDKTKIQFIPQPGWPASSTIEVAVDRKGLRSVQGGLLTEVAPVSFSTGTDRKIVVYLDSQRATAIENGQVVKTFRVSTGKPATPTVTGSFYIYARFPIKTMRSKAKPGQPGHYVVENVPYAQYFHADYAFHGAWWHNGFGHPASHGCVNMSTRSHNNRWPGVPEDAGWLYHWASLGVPVTVTRGSPPTQVAMR